MRWIAESNVKLVMPLLVVGYVCGRGEIYRGVRLTLLVH